MTTRLEGLGAVCAFALYWIPSLLHASLHHPVGVVMWCAGLIGIALWGIFG